MEPNRASITALVTAYCRAYHAAHDTPKIFDDFLAGKMFTEDEHAFFNQSLEGLLNIINPSLAATDPDPASALAHVMQAHTGPITLSRSRYAEDCLEQAINQGVKQYVILGAGMDTFAYRRPDLLETIQVFEVDHPDTQAMKVQRLSMLGGDIPDHLHFVPIDFAKEDLTKLLNSDYDPQKLSFFSWLGVTYYLPRDIIFLTLDVITDIAFSGSSIVFDYMDHDAFDPEKASRRIRLMQAIASQAGELMQAGFDPIKLQQELKKLGFDLQENLNPAEIEKHYFQGRTDAYHAFEQVHFARAVVE